MKRKRIPLKEKLAAALYDLARERTRGNDLSIIKWRLNAISANEVIAKFDFDHLAYHSHGGKDAWWNLTPLLRAEHREKTKRDLATIAKGKRIQRKQNEHQARMEAKHADTENSGSDGARDTKAKRSRAQFGRRLSRSRK